jgi:hypothetical protein
MRFERYGQTARPLIVLLDEVETLAADRDKPSLEANPIDVHRATHAVSTARLPNACARYSESSASLVVLSLS